MRAAEDLAQVVEEQVAPVLGRLEDHGVDGSGRWPARRGRRSRHVAARRSPAPPHWGTAPCPPRWRHRGCELLSVMPEHPGRRRSRGTPPSSRRPRSAAPPRRARPVRCRPHPRSAASISSRDTANVGPQLDEGQHSPHAPRPHPRPGLHLVDPAEIGRRVAPPVRAGQVDQLPGGQVRDQAALGLRLDLLPGGLRDRGQLAVEVVHHSPPFRLPIPSDPARGGPAGPPSASASASTSVTGSAGEQVRPQVTVEHRITPSKPFERHHGVLLLLVAVVRQDVGQASSLVACTRWSYQSTAWSSSVNEMKARWRSMVGASSNSAGSCSPSLAIGHHLSSRSLDRCDDGTSRPGQPSRPPSARGSRASPAWAGVVGEGLEEMRRDP